MNALIGYTGFVGSNIGRQAEFLDTYNSTNIGEIDGKEYDLVVCAGARAEKWRVNQEPVKDLAEIDGLIGHLRTVKVGRFLLISTVDVYKNPVGVNEDTPVELDGLHPYGTNRYHLEQFCADQFNTLTIRLPGLFGPGLKKNVIYDLLHINNVDRIHYAGSFQYYNLVYIWRDIMIALNAGAKLINFATEPVRTDVVARECFGIEDFTNEPAGVNAGSYDMQTKYAGLYGKSGNYIYSQDEVLRDIAEFVRKEQGHESN